MSKGWLCLCLPLLLSGCIQSIRLEDRGIMEGMAVDRAQGGYRVTMQIAGAGSGASAQGAPELTVVEQEGKSLTEALARCGAVQGRQMFLGNCSLLVLSTELAEEGLEYLLEFFNANYRVNPSMTVLLASGEAAELLSAQKENPLLSAEGIVDSVNGGTRGGSLPRSHLIDVIGAPRGPQGAVALPVVSLQKEPGEEPESGGGRGQAGEPSAREEEGASPKEGGGGPAVQPVRLQYDGIGLLKGNRLDAFAAKQDAQGLAWMLGRIEARALEVSEPEFGRVSAVLRPKKVRLEPELTGDLLVLNVRLKLYSTVLEVELAEGGRLGDEERAYVQRLQARAVAKELESLLADTLKQGYDVVGVSELVKQRCPDYYKAHEQDWEEALRAMGYAVEVECVIDRSGVGKQTER